MQEGQNGGDDQPLDPGQWSLPGHSAQVGGYARPAGYGSGEYLGQLPPQPPRRPGRASGVLVYVAVAAVAAAVGAGLVAALNRAPSSSPGGNSPVSTSSPGGLSTSQEQAIASRVEPGIVDISGNLQYEGDADAATGMVISSSGLVLTNNHVIDDTTELTATLVSDGQTFKAQWLGYDQADDVSVIKLEGASGLPTVPLGNSSAVKVGDNVVAIGNAGGVGGTPSVVTGSITSLNQTISASLGELGGTETLENMLQTNADIVEGDSGGPLVNASGQVIGMDTASSTASFTSQGPSEGFAIPISKALSIAKQIIDGKSSSKVKIGASGFLGVLLANGSGSSDSSPAQQQKSELSQGQQPEATQSCVADNQTSGVPSAIAPVATGTLILGDLCGTPASTAGITAGDVITAVDGHAISSPDSLTAAVASYQPGDTVTVTWVDTSGKQHTSNLDLLPAPPK
jgi:S1-C subfamily serine protease